MQKKSRYEILSRRMNKEKEFHKEVFEYTSFLQGDAKNIVRLWHYINRIDQIPSCTSCGKETSFSKRGTHDNHGYNMFCTLSCRTTFNNNRRTDAQLEEIREKISRTSIEKYGTKHFFQSQAIREKITHTFQDRYGVVNPSQIDNVKKKKEATFMSKFGVVNPSQSPEVQAKKTSSSKKKIFISPGGKRYDLDGYEPYAIDLLIKSGLNDEDILTGKQITSLLGNICFRKGEKKSYYHPDIFIASQQKIIEVKSEYWYNRQIDLNQLKRDAILSMNLLFEFWVFDTSLKLSILK